MAGQKDSQRLALGALAPTVDQRIEALSRNNYVARFWAKDATLWAGREDAVRPWLGWVDLATQMRDRIAEIEAFATEIRSAGFERVVLCGMGGSSLAPLVFSECVADGRGLPLHVLDLTDPASVLAVEDSGALDRTLFVVASKSGSTAEPTAFDHYFWEKLQRGQQFVAITDPGSPFERSAVERGWRRIFRNFADVGGRFSALSYFGLVPAALLGIDVAVALERASLVDEDAFALGVALGEAAKLGRNKLTFLTPHGLYPFGLWLEQLIAESTGKEGRGILPIAGEPVGDVANYGSDRFFALLSLGGESLESEGLIAAGHPVVEIRLNEAMDVFQEMMRWEVATAIAGAVIGINPFDQPNVQESKDVTKRLLAVVERDGSLPASTPALVEGAVEFHTDSFGAKAAAVFGDFFKDVAPNDFVALMAFLPEIPAATEILLRLQGAYRDGLRLATTMGYGPRFLHSTGQFHKGGPNGGFFIQFTADHPRDAAIPGQRASWGQFVDAQAAGDLEALRAKGRRAISIHLRGDLVAALTEFETLASAWLDQKKSI